MSVINMGICDHMHKLPHIHITYLCQHMDKHCILDYIPVIGRQHILGSLVQDRIQCQLILSLLLGHIEGHAVCTGIQVHLM